MVFRLFFLFFCGGFLWASSPQSCYSVQLSSFVLKKNTTYDFEKEDYPKQCELLDFGKVNAVRCGCFELYKDAKSYHEDLSYFYPQAAIVSTYKARFKQRAISAKQQKQKLTEATLQKKVAKLQTQPLKKEPTPAIAPSQRAEQVKMVQTVSTADETAQNAAQNAAPNAVPQTSLFDDVSLSGEVALLGQNYLDAPKEKSLHNLTALSDISALYEKEGATLGTKLHAQADYSDLASERKNERTFVRLDELYGSYDFEEDQLLLGKSVRFWGALELRNITDGFNPQELRDDPFDMSKLGVWNASYTHFTENGELSFITKFYEQEREMAAFPYVYYYFPKERGGLPYEYENRLLSQEGAHRPSFYLTYSGSLDSDVALDYAFVVQNGYDSQRYFTSALQSDLSKTLMQENAYLVNKISTYNTLVMGSTLLKLEGLYTDVLESEVISDYAHVGFGVEHALDASLFGGVLADGEFSLLSEYYSYTTFEEGKRSDLELFELFQNDLFLGARYRLNDESESSVSGGGVLDLEYDEEVYFVEYESRLWDRVMLNFDYRLIEPSASALTAFKLMGRHERLSLRLGVAF